MRALLYSRFSLPDILRKRLPAVLIISLGCSAIANERPRAVSLSGDWEFCASTPLVEVVADRSKGFDPPQLSPELDELIPESVRTDPHAALPESPEWKAIAVPAAWEQVAGIAYNGAGWYRRSISIPAEWLASGQRIWIEFDAVATVAGVWLNGKWSGGNVGDYTRFRVEATRIAQKGSNQLLLYVDELPGHVTQGFLSAVAPHHGGVWQETRMYATGPVAVEPDGIHLQADPAGGEIRASVDFTGKWDEKLPAPQLIVRRYDPAQPESASPAISPVEGSAQTHLNAEQNQWQIRLKLPGAKMWSPEDPALYLAEVSLPRLAAKGTESVSDRVLQKFGFRTVEIAGSEVLLNGKPIHIRSVLNWGYYPRIVSPAPPPQAVREEFAYIKSLGFNAETICLMNMPDYFYDIADEMGMFIWQEYPTWHNDFTAARLPTYRRLFPAFLRRDRNHPSIILRSISVEAGVQDQTVMAELVNLAKEMAATPLQDNNSWMWMSNLELSDWYGDDNYWNNSRWAKYFLLDLPAQLDTLPAKPYMMGETIAGSVWIDTDTLQKITPGVPLSNWLHGVDQPLPGETYPYWFPACFESCLGIEQQLRSRYNALVPAGKDIVRDYLVPQSYRYSLLFRRFQVELLHADPRYRGYTLFLIRDLPRITSGLIDDAGKFRWKPEDWAWFGEHTAAPVQVSEVRPTDPKRPLIERAPQLEQWDNGWGMAANRNGKVAYLNTGYADLNGLFRAWPNAREVTVPDIGKMNPSAEKPLLATSILTGEMLRYLESGGAVLLFPSQWPGGLGSAESMFWGGAFFMPPVGVFSEIEIQRMLQLHQYDLTHQVSQAIPVEALSIADKVDPLLSFFEMHNQRDITRQDQLFATRVGKGLFIASALDHSAEAGQWMLGHIVEWAQAWKETANTFPAARMEPEELRKFAAEKVQEIILLNADWRFKLDPEQTGDQQGWERSDLDEQDWPMIQASQLWERQGYRYDGMAWYRKWIEAPASLKNKKITLVAEGVDDAYRLYVNGVKVAEYGSFTEHAKSVHYIRTETDLTDLLHPGQKDLLVLQVIDLYGGGGIGRPIYLRIE